jgi:cell division protein FtsN
MKTQKTYRPVQDPQRVQQRGGFTTGLVVGLLIGLGLALAVALYVTKAPVPFVLNKVPQRTAEQDAAEAERNRNWNPNAGLSSNKGIAAPAASKPGASAAASKPAAVAKPAVAEPDPAALLEDKPAADPSASTEPASDPFTYFVQAGAYSQAEEADQQRARLAILGMESKVTEREQAGRTTYRVRVGPFDHRIDERAAFGRRC